MTNYEISTRYVDAKAEGCVGDGVADDTAKMGAAASAAVAAGVPLFFPPGQYNHTGLDFSTLGGLCIRGDTVPAGGTQQALCYTGSGAGSAVVLPTQIRFENVGIGYNNASFTGILLDGTTAGDVFLDHCTVRGTSSATSATLLMMGGQEYHVGNSYFEWGARAIDTNGAANVASIDNCHFQHFTGPAVNNARQTWSISNCIFEALTAGSYSDDGGVSTTTLTYFNNWHGDTAAQTNMVHLLFSRGAMLTVFGNFFGASGSGSHALQIGVASSAVAQALIMGNYFSTSATNNDIYFPVASGCLSAVVLGNDSGGVALINNPVGAQALYTIGNEGIGAEAANFRRISASINAGSLVSGDFALSAGWGNTATVTVTSGGSDQRFRISVLCQGTGIAANPTVTFTFHNGAWSTTPYFSTQRGDTLATAGEWRNTTRSLTAPVVTFVGTPVSGETYILDAICLG